MEETHDATGPPAPGRRRILGNDEYRFPAGSGDINWSDKTIAAYNRMTTPLPITGKDPDNGTGT